MLRTVLLVLLDARVALALASVVTSIAAGFGQVIPETSAAMVGGFALGASFGICLRQPRAIIDWLWERAVAAPPEVKP